MEKVLVIASGGLDSISMASKYLNDDLELITFDYGQKGVKELEVVKKFGEKFDKKVTVVDIQFMADLFGENQLSGSVEIESSYTGSVVVPLRNAVFIQIAMVKAYTEGFDKVILGSHTDDIAMTDDTEFSYPDCSPQFFKAMQLAQDLGTFRDQGTVEIESASTLGYSKSDLMKIGYENLGDFIFETWSCYKSDLLQCGDCESCNNRKRFFDQVGITDLTSYHDYS